VSNYSTVVFDWKECYNDADHLDGRTDGQTDIIAISISRVRVLTRNKNIDNILTWPREP